MDDDFVKWKARQAAAEREAARDFGAKRRSRLDIAADRAVVLSTARKAGPKVGKQLIAEAGIEPPVASYTHSTLGACFLPATDPGKVDLWEHKNGRRSIVVQGGMALKRDRTKYVAGIPWGAGGRLALAAIMDRGARSYSRTVEMPTSVAGLMRELGLPLGGSNETRFADQFIRVAAAHWYVHYEHDDMPPETHKTDIVKEIAWWTGGSADQPRLIPAEIVLDKDFHSALQERRMPFDMRAYVALSRSPLALDIYLWLTQQAGEMIRCQQKKRRHDWTNVQAVFAGGTSERPARFKVRFRKAMADVLQVYPDANVYPNDDAVWVYSSKPPVPMRRAKRLRKVHGKG